jgi:hypothetical protein
MNRCRKTFEMTLDASRPLTEALRKLAYELDLVTVAAHILDQNRIIPHGSEERRVTRAKDAYEMISAALSKGRREIERIERLAFDSYVDAVPDAVRANFPPLSDSPMGISQDACQQQHDRDHKDYPEKAGRPPAPTARVWEVGAASDRQEDEQDDDEDHSGFLSRRQWPTM